MRARTRLAALCNKEAKSPYISSNRSLEISLFEQPRSYVILDIWFERARVVFLDLGERWERAGSAFTDAVNLLWLMFETKEDWHKIQQEQVDVLQSHITICTAYSTVCVCECATASPRNVNRLYFYQVMSKGFSICTTHFIEPINIYSFKRPSTGRNFR